MEKWESCVEEKCQSEDSVMTKASLKACEARLSMWTRQGTDGRQDLII